MDRYRLDGHKLIYHPKRLSAWLAGENVYPIYAEVSPSGACNHRCSYCGLDFMGYKPRFLDAEVLSERLSEMSSLGLKSVMFAGEGEPFLHKDAEKIAASAKKGGLDVSFTTNAVILPPGVLRHCSWIKAGIDAASPSTYAKIRRAPASDFNKAIGNMSAAAKLKKRDGLKCSLGIQMVLLPENFAEAEALAKKAKAIGMDYFVAKPYSQHPQSLTKSYRSVNYAGAEALAEKLEKLNSPNFSAVVRLKAMKKWDSGEKRCKKCLAMPFWTYIDSAGNVWACSVYLGKKEFFCGNVYKKTFRQIWEGSEKKRRALAAGLDASRCRLNCRMDEANRFLHELKTPPEHANFI